MCLRVLAAEARHPFVDRLRALAHGFELAAVLGGELGVGPADALGEVGARRYLVRQAVEHDQPLLGVVEHDAGGQRLDGLAQQVAPVGIGHAQHQHGCDQAGADERHNAADDLQQGIAAAARHRFDVRRRLDVVALGQAVEVGADRHDLAPRRLVERIGATPHRDLRRHAMHDLVAALAQPVEQGAVRAFRVEAATGAVERRGEAVPGLERRRLVVRARDHAPELTAARHQGADLGGFGPAVDPGVFQGEGSDQDQATGQQARDAGGTQGALAARDPAEQVAHG